MAYMGRLHSKGVPFSDFKYMRGLEFQLLKYMEGFERVGSVISVGKKAQKGLTDALHGCERSCQYKGLVL